MQQAQRQTTQQATVDAPRSTSTDESGAMSDEQLPAGPATSDTPTLDAAERATGGGDEGGDPGWAANIGSEDFWEDLRRDVVSVVDSSFEADQDAVTQFSTDLRAEPDGSLNLDVLGASMAVAGVPTDVRTIVGVVQKTYGHFISQQRSPSVHLSDFTQPITSMRDAVRRSVPRTGWDSVSDSAPAVFQHLAGLMASETEQNRTAIRQRANATAEAEASLVPTTQSIQQDLIQAWCSGAENSLVDRVTGSDPEGFDAGYIDMYVDLFPDQTMNYGRHAFRSLAIDDVDNPEGTKQALIHAFGAESYVDQLPLPGNIHLQMGEYTTVWEKGRGDSVALGTANFREGWTGATMPVISQMQAGSNDSTVAAGERATDWYLQHVRPRISLLPE